MNRKNRFLWPVVAPAMVLLAASRGRAVQQAAVPAPAPAPVPIAPRDGNLPQPPTDLPRIHDPVMAQENGVYYLFGTGRGLTQYVSKDRVRWQRQNRVLDPAPPWTATTIPGSRDSYWAPDISYFSGAWHLYYSVSTFGKNRSAIGLATNETLDASRADYKWEDRGLVTQSQPTDNFNAIDPNFFLDDDGAARLIFGSFWGGLQMLAIDARTGKPPLGARPLAIAARPRTPEIQGSIEGAFLVRHNGFYFLFCSFDFCCRGISSTYNIRVGRSAKLDGPYLDRDGKPMLDGGGTLVLAGEGRWHGPGHNAVFYDKGVDWLVYHAYDGEDGGASKLQMRALKWDAQDWPQVVPAGAPATTPETVAKPVAGG